MTRAKSFSTDAHWASNHDGYHHKVLPIIVKIEPDTDAANPLDPEYQDIPFKVERPNYTGEDDFEVELSEQGNTFLKVDDFYITLTDEVILKEWEGDKGRAVEWLIVVAEEYRRWADGDVWGYTVEADGEHVESCWGFYGNDAAEEAAYDAFDPLYCIKFSVPFATTVFNPATNRYEPLNDIRFWWIKWLEQRFEKAKKDKDWRWLDVFYRWHHDWTKDLADSCVEHLEGYHRDYGKPAVWFPPHEVPVKYPLVFDWWMGGLLPNNTEDSLSEWDSQWAMAAYMGISLLGNELRERMQPSLMFDLGGEDDETFLTRHMNQMCVSFTCKPLQQEQ